MTTTMAHSCALWFFRSDSNIVEDTQATHLREVFTPFQDWKAFTKQNKTNRLEITCFNCGNVATYCTSITGSYPLCNNCRD